MPTGLQDLLHHAREGTTPTDIREYAPVDPGYEQYVAEFTHIWETGILPHRANFEITETVGLTRWSDADRNTRPSRFRRFRTFTNAVGMNISMTDERAAGLMPANYFAISLLDDARELEDAKLLALLPPAFHEYHSMLLRVDPEEAPFFLLARILLHGMGANDALPIDSLAKQLIASDESQHDRATREFLWGNTYHDQLHSRWKIFIHDFLPPATPSLDLLRSILLP